MSLDDMARDRVARQRARRLASDEDREDALVLVRLGHEAGGRVDPARILQRKPESRARQMFLRAQDEGWLDGEGWLTEAGRREAAG